VSSNFVTGHGGASVAGLSKNFVYFSEPLDGWQAGPNHVELNNIANGKSKMLAYRENVRASSKALCWIQPKPNPWTQGMYISVWLIFHVISDSVYCYIFQKSPYGYVFENSMHVSFHLI
jgi:hypothetical protein